MTERQIQAEILSALGKRPDVRLFRNSVGHVEIDGRHITYGLCTGSSDLIGLKKLTITPDMVGKTVGVFVALEVKNERGRPTKEQAAFVRMVKDFGGLAGVVRSVDEATTAVPKLP